MIGSVQKPYRYYQPSVFLADREQFPKDLSFVAGTAATHDGASRDGKRAQKHCFMHFQTGSETLLHALPNGLRNIASCTSKLTDGTQRHVDNIPTFQVCMAVTVNSTGRNVGKFLSDYEALRP